MLKNILGSLVFVAAVMALINLIGNVMVSPTTVARTPHPLKHEEQVAPSAKAPAPQAMPESMAAPETAAPASAEPLVAMAGDADSGKSLFRKKCYGCHTMSKGEPDRTGPNLWGIVGRKKGAVEGFRYSAPMRARGGVWSEAEILGFIAGPRTFLPDTKMTFAGLKKERDRADVLAYLNTLKD